MRYFLGVYCLALTLSGCSDNQNDIGWKPGPHTGGAPPDSGGGVGAGGTGNASTGGTGGASGSIGSEGAAGSGAGGSDASTCSPFEPLGPVVEIASVFNYAVSYSTAAKQTRRFAVVSSAFDSSPRITLLNEDGSKIRSGFLGFWDGSPGVPLPLAIASDGTRFAVLIREWIGASSNVRFQLLNADAESDGPPIDLGPAGAGGAAVWTDDGWLAVWLGGGSGGDGLWSAKLAPNGALTVAPQALLQEPNIGGPRIARTPSGATAIVWQSQEVVRWARLQPDGTLGARQDFAVPQAMSVSIAAAPEGFVLGWTPTGSSSGEVVRLGEDGTVRAGPRLTPMTLGAVALSGTTMVGVGARAGINGRFSVEVFDLLDDLTLGKSVTLAEVRDARAFELNVGANAVLATWAEYDSAQSHIVSVRAVRPSCER
jgi:hypothetical protein